MSIKQFKSWKKGSDGSQSFSTHEIRNADSGDADKKYEAIHEAEEKNFADRLKKDAKQVKTRNEKREKVAKKLGLTLDELNEIL